MVVKVVVLSAGTAAACEISVVLPLDDFKAETPMKAMYMRHITSAAIATIVFVAVLPSLAYLGLFLLLLKN